MAKPEGTYGRGGYPGGAKHTTSKETLEKLNHHGRILIFGQTTAEPLTHKTPLMQQIPRENT